MQKTQVSPSLYVLSVTAATDQSEGLMLGHHQYLAAETQTNQINPNMTIT